MCQLKPSERMHVVTVRLASNNGVRTIDLGRQFEHVKEVRLSEYHFVNPNGGAVVPGAWKLHFRAEHFYPHETTNADGPLGTVLVINNATVTHVLYTEHPRVLSKSNQGRLSKVDIGLFTETGALATFTEATLVLQVICHDPQWSAEQVMFEDMNLPMIPSLQFDSRARFNPNNGL